jgi:hypothetical protein
LVAAAGLPDDSELLDVELQVLAPSGLEDGPQPFNRIEFARVGWQEQQLEVIGVEVVVLLGLVDLQVV